MMDLLNFDFEGEIQRNEDERQRLLESQGVGRSDAADGAAGPGRGKHQETVCRHWLKNMCIKGDFCDFIHQYDFDRMPFCRKFQRYGHCADYERGSCPLKHETSAAQPSQQTTGAAGVASNRSRLPAPGPRCVHYFFGFCRAGPRCDKRHEQRPADEALEFLHDWYLQLLISNREVIRPPTARMEKKLEELDQQCREMARQEQGDNSLAGGNAKSGGRGTSQPGETPGSVAGLASSLVEGETVVGGEVSGAGEGSGDETPSDFGVGIPAPPPVEGKLRCYAIKSLGMGNIFTSVQLGIWATGRHNTRKFEAAFVENDHVLFFFSANESGGFQGVARMMSLPDPGLHRGVWGAMASRLGPNFRVQWLKQCSVDFDDLGHLTNPLNDHQVIKKSRDGQEFPYWLARAICRRMAAAPDLELVPPPPVVGSEAAQPGGNTWLPNGQNSM